ncbi:MAG: 1-(5-phosphoribosyl)-5-[(5-phosphoribosylamino)methylideneamino] imidazole-4-carboxamide isomerase [Candidatus Hecatellales archaeon B24]|nr:MAG: 1-(5-phosphoribosyl)-5-[(5-phosphoribosylamino)methylideneamino] imidazole-4-carboxamide isomerase [Candidatus Hecatellales archaeon B24]
MEVIPSVDVKNGKCVKLVRGKPGSGRIISEDPVEAALEWERLGARRLHLVDLDAALYGGRGNREVILEIVRRVSIPVEVGGGVRSLQDAGEILRAGAQWIIFGTAAFKNPGAVYKTVETYGAERVMVAIDSAGGKVLVEGWTGYASASLFEALKTYERLGIYAFLYTDVAVEGTLEGVRLERVRRLVEASSQPIIYAGGVSSLEDLERLKGTGVIGVVVGRALYDGRFTLEEAEKVAEGA